MLMALRRRATTFGLSLGVICLAALPAGTVSAASRAPIEIGMVAPLTGPFSTVGTGNRDGAEAAVRELNRRGGVRGRRVVLRLHNDASTPTQGVIRMHELVADRGVVGMLGSGSAGTALASAEIATRVGLPYLTMAPIHSLVYPPRPYVYAPGHTARIVAYKTAAYLRASGVKRIALLRSGTAVGAEGAAVVKELARRYGFTISLERVFPATPPTTFAADLIEIKNSDAQVAWVWAVDDAAITITKEARQLRLRQRLVYSHGIATPRYFGPACPDSNDVTFPSAWSLVPRLLPDSNPSKQLALKVDRLAGGKANGFFRGGYTAVMMLAQAMRTGGMTRSTINRALERMKFVGADGIHRFSPRKHVSLSARSLLMYRIRKCRPTLLPGQDLDG